MDEGGSVNNTVTCMIPYNTMDDSSQLDKKLTEITSQLSELRKELQFSVTPKFLNVSIQTNDLTEHAIELWRLRNRLTNLLENVSESQREIITNSMDKLMRYLGKNDIEIIDNTNEKYNEGRNLEILAVEKDKNVSEPLIKETKEPTILFKGQVIRKGKVIIVDKEINNNE